MMFKWLPDTPVDWDDVWLGAVLTAAFFEIGKLGDRILHRQAGTGIRPMARPLPIIVVLIWVYYSSQIILMGAEITHAFAIHKGSIRNAGRVIRNPTSVGRELGTKHFPSPRPESRCA